MKFGKRLRDLLEDSLPEYRNKFLSYKELKKKLKSLPSGDGTSPAGAQAPGESNTAVQVPANQGPGMSEELFVKLLNNELEKFNCFFMEKEEEFVIRMQVLREQMEQLGSSCGGGSLSQCNGCGPQVHDLRKAIVSLHGEMVLLENYSALNYTGLVKILKKHDKRTGLLLRYPYISTVLRQPFLTTDILSKLVKECEDRMQQLFPSQPSSGSQVGERDGSASCVVAERGEKEVAAEGDDSPPSSPDSDSGQPAGIPAVGDVQAVYRSALTALRSLQEIRGSSKTPHPLLAEMGSFPGVSFQRPKESESSADTTQAQARCSVTSTGHQLLAGSRLVESQAVVLRGEISEHLRMEQHEAEIRSYRARGNCHRREDIEPCRDTDDGADSSLRKKQRTDGSGGCCSGSSQSQKSQNSCRKAAAQVVLSSPSLELPGSS